MDSKQEDGGGGAAGTGKVRKVSKGISQLGSSIISLETPNNSIERDSKRPCRSVSAAEEEVREIVDYESNKASKEEEKSSKAAAAMFGDAAIKRGRPLKKEGDMLVHGLKISTSPDDDFKAEMKLQITEMNSKVDEMEREVSGILKMRRASMKEQQLVGLTVTEDDREKAVAAIKKQRSLDNARREAAHAKRAADLMRIFGNILRQITQHKWAWPFMQPVDVEGLGLHDYYDIIKKPMDFGTIREKMDAKDGNGYKSVQEIADDVRLVFSNAMTYNEVDSDVYVMAKTLSEKFEEKWKIVLEPKLQEEEAKRKQELMEMEVQEGEEAKAAEEAALDRMAHEICRKLNDLEDDLEGMKLLATSKCRLMSIEEKRQLGQNLGRLPPPSLNRVIQIIARNNPGFNAAVVEVEVDIDALDTATLWQLQSYVQMVLSQQKQAEGADQTPTGAAGPVKKKPAPSTKVQK